MAYSVTLFYFWYWVYLFWFWMKYFSLFFRILSSKDGWQRVLSKMIRHSFLYTSTRLFSVTWFSATWIAELNVFRNWTLFVIAYVIKTMIDLVVYHIEFTHMGPLNMVFILMGVSKVGFTGWLVFQPRSNSSG